MPFGAYNCRTGELGIDLSILYHRHLYSVLVTVLKERHHISIYRHERR